MKMPLSATSRTVIAICTLTLICVILYTSRVQVLPVSKMEEIQTQPLNVRVHIYLNKTDGKPFGSSEGVQIQLFRNIVNSIAEPLKTILESFHLPRLGCMQCTAPDEEEGFDDSLNMTIPTWDYLTKKYSDLLRGGHNKPANPSHKVVIILPYRDRRVHLKIFLDHMHPFLKRQNLDYVIYVVEMVQGGLFNRGALSNIGFLEVMKRENTPCVIFHDVDMLPTNDQNLYFCNDSMRHYAVALRQYNYTLFYEGYIGGIVAFPPKLYMRINGYSNRFEGWGGEDDDLFTRIDSMGTLDVGHHLNDQSVFRFDGQPGRINTTIPWTRQSEELGRYETFEHKRQPELVNRLEFLKQSDELKETDGLNSIKYTVDAFERRLLFTWLLVNITKQEDDLSNVTAEYKPYGEEESKPDLQPSTAQNNYTAENLLKLHGLGRKPNFNNTFRINRQYRAPRRISVTGHV